MNTDERPEFDLDALKSDLAALADEDLRGAGLHQVERAAHSAASVSGCCWCADGAAASA